MCSLCSNIRRLILNALIFGSINSFVPRRDSSILLSERKAYHERSYLHDIRPHAIYFIHEMPTDIAFDTLNDAIMCFHIRALVIFSYFLFSTFSFFGSWLPLHLLLLVVLHWKYNMYKSFSKKKEQERRCLWIRHEMFFLLLFFPHSFFLSLAMLYSFAYLQLLFLRFFYPVMETGITARW